MKKIVAIGLVSAVILTLTGCAGVGNENLRSATEQSVSTQIVEGKTTKANVRSMFGSPDKTEFTDGGLEIWRYEFAKMHGDVVNYIPVVNLFGSSASGVKKELVVMFDDKSIVKHYSMSEADVSRKTGIFNQ